jgi:hypothetical protein
LNIDESIQLFASFFFAIQYATILWLPHTFKSGVEALVEVVSLSFPSNFFFAPTKGLVSLLLSI